MANRLKAISRKPRKPDADPETFVVTVWDHEGGIVETLWEATYEESEACRERYCDDPLKTVVVDYP